MTQGRPGRLQLLYKEEAGRGHGGRGLSREGPIGSCSVTAACCQSDTSSGWGSPWWSVLGQGLAGHGDMGDLEAA